MQIVNSKTSFMTKKITYVMMSIVLMMSLTFTSCTSKKDRIKMMVNQTQKELPVDLGIAGKITSFVYEEEENEVVATVMVNSGLIEKGLGNQNEDEIRQNLMLTMNLNKSFKELLTMMAEADLTFKFVYVMGNTGKEVEVALTPEDVFGAEELDEKTAAEMYLENEIKNSKKSLPMMVDEMTKWVDMQNESNCIVYLYELEESNIDINLMKENAETIKETLSQNLLASKDPTFVAFKQNCKAAGKGIKYKYTGSKSKDTFEVLFNASEL